MRDICEERYLKAIITICKLDYTDNGGYDNFSFKAIF